MTYVLGLHLLLAAGCAGLARHVGSRVLLVGALAPAVSFGWLCLQVDDVLAGDYPHAVLPWADALGLEVALRLDALGLVLGLPITGIGALVLVYSVGYFRDSVRQAARHSVLLVLFAGSMLGLVLADHLIALYVAWELTTVWSFLLIGGDGQRLPERDAAARALLVTTGAGFVMLFGLVILGERADSYRMSALVADPPHGSWISVAIALVLLGALAKSAQAPFHAWLPAAMVAATPVSAYLHAAAMVKAGVFLVAALTPAFAETVPWREIALPVGTATMVLGGWRALRQTDLKRLLAFGTIAQLGFLLVLLGAGTRTAALAGATMLIAHALFKAALFLVVGVIEHETGTRDLRELRGLRRRAPGLAVFGLVACISMVGLPPTVGYLGKEAALEAFVEPYAPAAGWLLTGITIGSGLTVAYTLRFWWGAFGGRSGGATPMHRISPFLVVPTALLALCGVALSLLPHALDQLAAAHASAYAVHGKPYHLALWHGLTPTLLLSALSLVLGTALHMARGPLATVRRGTSWVPATGRLEDGTVSGIRHGAHRVVSATQVGSLPTYLWITLLVVAAGPLVLLVSNVGPPSDVRMWDTPGQAMLALAITAVVAAALVTRHRLSAALLVSASGYLIAGIFVVHGAPALALTQILVETLTLLLFVVVLRRMRPRVRMRPLQLLGPRAIVAAALGVLAASATLATGARHRPSRATERYFHEAPHAGGTNVVNVILAEFRALDTLGEVTVLAVAATGVASLVLVSGRLGKPPAGANTEPGRERGEEVG